MNVRRFVRSFLIALALASTAARGAAYAQTNYHFFPTRPAGATLHASIGILTSYGVGNDTGGLSIRKADGHREQFFLAFPTIVDGKRFDVYSCSDASKTPDIRTGDCTPPNVRVGKTRVRVTYWWQKAPWGTMVKVSDTMSVADR